MNAKKRNALTGLGIFMILLLFTPAFSHQEGNTARLMLAQRRTSRNSMDCNGVSVAVSDTPDFQGENVEAYWSASSEIVFATNKNPIYCVNVGFGWSPEGFTYGMHENSGKQILLFRIRGRSSERYFDVRGQREVYHIPYRSNLIVSDTRPLEPGIAMRSLKAWQGAYSSVDMAEYLRITSEAQWNDMWQRHDKTGGVPPEVGFDKNMVIAILMGRMTNVSGVRIADFREIDGVIRFRFVADSYQTVGAVDNVTPFGFFVIPRINKKIIIEENVQSLMRGPSHWKLRAEFGEVSEGDPD